MCTQLTRSISAFPRSETIYGQTFLCMSVSDDAAVTETIAKHYLLTTPYVYYSSIPASYKTKFPTLGKVLDKDWVKTAGTVKGR